MLVITDFISLSVNLSTTARIRQKYIDLWPFSNRSDRTVSSCYRNTKSFALAVSHSLRGHLQTAFSWRGAEIWGARALRTDAECDDKQSGNNPRIYLMCDRHQYNELLQNCRAYWCYSAGDIIWICLILAVNSMNVKCSSHFPELLSFDSRHN